MWLVEQVPHYRNIMYFESVFRPWLCIVFLHVLYQTQLEDSYIVCLHFLASTLKGSAVQ